MKKTNIICLALILLASIFSGIIIAANLNTVQVTINNTPALIQVADSNLAATLTSLKENMSVLNKQANNVQTNMKKEDEESKKLSQQLAQLASKTSSNKNLSDSTYEKMIVNRLGKAIYNHSGKNSDIMIFELKNEDLRGYMAKIKLKNSKALRVTLNPENKPTGETPTEAAKRKGGIFAVNGGGFASATLNGNKVLMPLGNAMIEGKLASDFQPSWNDLAFAGFNKNNKLVGGVYYEEEELTKSGAWQGVSFVPVLVKNWDPTNIPKKWANAKQPRTVLGQYPNGDIFFIVVDGRQSNWSSGITLEEMQILLLRLGVMEAFNLDGGGSSAMYYNGKILNKPSDGKERKMATNIVVMP